MRKRRKGAKAQSGQVEKGNSGQVEKGNSGQVEKGNSGQVEKWSCLLSPPFLPGALCRPQALGTPAVVVQIAEQILDAFRVRCGAIPFQVVGKVSQGRIVPPVACNPGQKVYRPPS